MAILDLTKILEENELVLVDGSIRGHPREDVHESISSESGYLRWEKILLQRFIRVLAHPNAVTLPEVVDEVGSYVSALESQLNGIFLRNVEFYKGRRRGLSHIKNKEIFGNILDLSAQAYRSCRRAQIEIVDERYDTLVEMIKGIDKIIQLKKLTRKGIVSNNNTDERLCAFLYWASVEEGVKSALISCDKDFLNLLGVSRLVLEADDFFPYNEAFRERIEANPFRFYLMEEDFKEEKIRVISMEDESYIRICRPSERQVSSLIERLYPLWRKYSVCGQVV